MRIVRVATMSPPDQISFFGASISFVDRRPNWDHMHRRLGHCFCVDRFGLQQIIFYGNH